MFVGLTDVAERRLRADVAAGYVRVEVGYVRVPAYTLTPTPAQAHLALRIVVLSSQIWTQTGVRCLQHRCQTFDGKSGVRLRDVWGMRARFDGAIDVVIVSIFHLWRVRKRARTTLQATSLNAERER